MINPLKFQETLLKMIALFRIHLDLNQVIVGVGYLYLGAYKRL